MKTKRLPQEILKLIACIAMFIDHFGAAVVIDLPIAHMAELYYTCRAIGRIAFPVYCFLLVEGMYRTTKPVKYISRLCVSILLAELPFDFLFEGGFTWEYQSVMVTLTLGAIMLLCMDKVKTQWVNILLWIPFALVADLCKCDYGGWGIATIAVLVLFNRLSLQALGILLINWAMNSFAISIFGIGIPIQLFAALAVISIAYYSGRKLTYNKAIQWAFYLFYPVHLLFLWMILRIFC